MFKIGFSAALLASVFLGHYLPVRMSSDRQKEEGSEETRDDHESSGDGFLDENRGVNNHVQTSHASISISGREEESMQRYTSFSEDDDNATFSTASPDISDNSTGRYNCMPQLYRGHWWPKTLAGQSATKACTLIEGDVTRLCVKRKRNLFKHKGGLPFWAEPNYTGCSLARRDWREDKKRIDPCPYDTSYATEWAETNANETAIAPCPSTMDVNRSDIVAMRRCQVQGYGSNRIGVWLEPYLVDCVVASIDSKIPPKEETVVSQLNVWMNDNSCRDDVTNSTTGSYQWNTTIVGGTDTGTCPFGSLIPPQEFVDFVKLSISLAKALTDPLKNVSLPVNHTGIDDLRPPHRNTTASEFTNETIRDIKLEFINQTIGLLENSMFEDHKGHSSGVGSRATSATASVWVDIGKAFDKIDQSRLYNVDSQGVLDAFEILQIVDSIPGSVLDIPLLPAIHIDTGKILVDLRGIDPVVTAIYDLIKIERAELMASAPKKTREVDNDNKSTGDGGILNGPVDDSEKDEEELLFNITAIVEAFEAAIKYPTRKCEENRGRDGVQWKHADTWMCRSGNASYLQDVVRVLDNSGYLDEIQDALDKTGYGEKVDGTLLRVVFRIWEAFQVWRQTRQKSKLTINAIQTISYLLSLDRVVLPPWLSQQIVQMIEDMANDPLPDDVTSVNIVTEHVVVNIAEVEKEQFHGITFASVAPSSPFTSSEHESTFRISESMLGDNMFLRIEGDLNSTLDTLDVDAVDEYFFLPQTIFNMSAHSIQNHTYCNSMNDNRSVSTTTKDTTPLLQFVIYENDQLFRTKSGEVPVVLAGSYKLNATRSWRVATRVISGTVGSYCMSGLPHPVVFLMEHQIDISDSEHRLCVFWNYNERGGLGAWSTSGCQVYVSDAKHTTCECDHLTNFAVIVDIWDQLGKGRLPVAHDWVLEIISFIGCSLSLVGLLVTIMCLIFVKRLREAKTTPTRLMLCITLFIAMTFLLVGMEQTRNPDACAVFAFFIHYFTLTSLMWMGIEAVYLYRNIVAVVINPDKNFFHYCCGIAWGVPAIICALTAAMNWDAYGDETKCWISEAGVFFGAFLAPVLVIVTLNFVVFGMVLCVLSNRPTDRIAGGSANSASVHREPAKRWKEFMGIVSITVILGLTWVFGAFSVGDGARITFLYLFTIFNSAQGFFIFIFYCLLSLVCGKKSRYSQRHGTSTDKMSLPSATSLFGSAKRFLHLQVDGEDVAKTGKMTMADWMASCKDLHLGVAQDATEGKINNAFCIMDEGSIHNITSAGDLASSNFDATVLGIVMSAQIVRTQSRSTDTIKVCDTENPTLDTPCLEGEETKAPEFVVSTGIVFGGKANHNRGSVTSIQ